MPRITTPITAYKQLKRLRQIVNVLIKHGFSEFLDQVRLWEHTNIRKRMLRQQEREFPTQTTPQRLRLALEELGPTFVKVGQILSTRPDLLPQNFILELENLQNRVAPIPTEIALSTIQSELGCPINEIFTLIEDKPVAAASLSQVHRAVLKTGEVVAIKVQRPHIADRIRADFGIINNLINMMERRLRNLGITDPLGLVKEFSGNINRELDFRLEANNMRRFAYIFRTDPHIHVPKVYRQLCTRRMLVMEYIEGIGISETDKLLSEEYDLKLIARHGADALLKSTLGHGFFHADPHPGNIFVLPGNRVCLLDYGMMGTLSHRQRELLVNLINEIANSDEKRASRSLHSLVESPNTLNAEKLEIDVANIIQEYTDLPMGELRFSTLLSRLRRILTTHQLHFPSHLIWLLKAIVTIEDTARRLDPDFNMVEYAKPYTSRLFTHRMNPIYQVREFYLTAIEWLGFIKALPYEARSVLYQLKEGQFKIEFEHVGLEPLRHTLNQITNRLTLAIVLAGLIVGSSLIIVSMVPPILAGIPVIGLVGYIIAGLVSIWLMLSILRNNRR